MDSLPAGLLQNHVSKIDIPVQDGFVRPGRTRRLGLLFRSHGREYERPFCLCELDKDLPKPAGACMDQAGLALLQRKSELVR